MTIIGYTYTPTAPPVTSWEPLDTITALIPQTVDAWSQDPDRTTRRDTYAR